MILSQNNELLRQTNKLLSRNNKKLNRNDDLSQNNKLQHVTCGDLERLRYDANPQLRPQQRHVFMLLEFWLFEYRRVRGETHTAKKRLFTNKS